MFTSAILFKYAAVSGLNNSSGKTPTTPSFKIDPQISYTLSTSGASTSSTSQPRAANIAPALSISLFVASGSCISLVCLTRAALGLSGKCPTKGLSMD